jgi:hypothetical protein
LKTYLEKFKYADKNFKDTQNSLSILSTSFSLKCLVEEINENENWLSLISKVSYSHDNGFDKFSIYRGSNIRIRLHIYWITNRVKNPNIHDHRWNFSSLILRGGYLSETYKLNNTGIDKFLYHYYSEASEKSNYELEYIKPVKLALTDTKQYLKNDINHGNAGEIHKILLNKNEITVSLFITSNYENDYARVFTNDMKLRGEKYKARKLSKKSLVQKLKAIL